MIDLDRRPDLELEQAETGAAVDMASTIDGREVTSVSEEQNAIAADDNNSGGNVGQPDRTDRKATEVPAEHNDKEVSVAPASKVTEPVGHAAVEKTVNGASNEEDIVKPEPAEGMQAEEQTNATPQTGDASGGGGGGIDETIQGRAEDDPEGGDGSEENGNVLIGKIVTADEIADGQDTESGEAPRSLTIIESDGRLTDATYRPADEVLDQGERQPGPEDNASGEMDDVDPRLDDEGTAADAVAGAGERTADTALPAAIETSSPDDDKFGLNTLTDFRTSPEWPGYYLTYNETIPEQVDLSAGQKQAFRDFQARLGHEPFRMNDNNSRDFDRALVTICGPAKEITTESSPFRILEYNWPKDAGDQFVARLVLNYQLKINPAVVGDTSDTVLAVVNAQKQFAETLRQELGNSEPADYEPAMLEFFSKLGLQTCPLIQLDSQHENRGFWAESVLEYFVETNRIGITDMTINTAFMRLDKIKSEGYDPILTAYHEEAHVNDLTSVIKIVRPPEGGMYLWPYHDNQNTEFNESRATMIAAHGRLINNRSIRRIPKAQIYGQSGNPLHSAVPRIYDRRPLDIALGAEVMDNNYLSKHSVGAANLELLVGLNPALLDAILDANKSSASYRNLINQFDEIQNGLFARWQNLDGVKAGGILLQQHILSTLYGIDIKDDSYLGTYKTCSAFDRTSRITHKAFVNRINANKI